jgi:SAM-dependent methyltransferase
MKITPDQASSTNLAHYEEHVSDFVRRTSSRDLSRIYAPFLRHLSPGDHILDAGCGPGRDSAYFLELGYRVTAIDASPAMVRAAQSLGVSANVATLQQMQFDSEFHGIWANASLLHVTKAEIEDVLGRLAQALQPGGVLLITLQEGKGARITEDGRFFLFFGSEEFSKLLLRLGVWSDLDTRRDVRKGPGPAWLHFLVRKISPGVTRRASLERSGRSAFGMLGDTSEIDQKTTTDDGVGSRPSLTSESAGTQPARTPQAPIDEMMRRVTVETAEAVESETATTAPNEADAKVPEKRARSRRR